MAVQKQTHITVQKLRPRSGNTAFTTYCNFRTLDKSPDGTVFIVMCFLCRGLEALGTSAFVTALFSAVAHEFPDSVITVMVI